MVKKLHKMSDAKKSSPQLSSAVKDSAQQIWLAGLGAFSKAQEEGSKVFDALVKEGMSIQRKTQSAAEEKITEATSRMSDMANDIQSQAGNRWDKLENIFEERVAKALSKLGVPSAKEVNALAARVDHVEKTMMKMHGPAAAPSGAQPAAKSAPKSAAKTAAKSAVKAVATPKTPSAAKVAAKRAPRPAVKRAAKKATPSAADASTTTASSAAE